MFLLSGYCGPHVPKRNRMSGGNQCEGGQAHGRIRWQGVGRLPAARARTSRCVWLAGRSCAGGPWLTGGNLQWDARGEGSLPKFISSGTTVSRHGLRRACHRMREDNYLAGAQEYEDIGIGGSGVGS